MNTDVLFPPYHPGHPRQATAMLDYCSRAHGTRQGTPWLTDPVAEFFRLVYGEPPAWRKLHPLCWMGVCARTLILDRFANTVLAAWSREPSLSVWSLGAGFDARWARLPLMASGKVAVHEWDAPELLRAKRKLLLRSPWVVAYERVRAHSLEIDEAEPADEPVPPKGSGPDAGVPAKSSPRCRWEEALRDAAAQEKGPVLVIAEGLFDLLPPRSKGRLLKVLAETLPRAVVVFDTLNEAAAAYDNKNPARYTGDSSLRTYGLADDAGRQLLESGWMATRAESVFREVQACPLRGWWKPLSWFPLSGSMHNAYRCFMAETALQA